MNFLWNMEDDMKNKLFLKVSIGIVLAVCSIFAFNAICTESNEELARELIISKDYGSRVQDRAHCTTAMKYYRDSRGQQVSCGTNYVQKDSKGSKIDHYYVSIRIFNDQGSSKKDIIRVVLDKSKNEKSILNNYINHNVIYSYDNENNLIGAFWISNDKIIDIGISRFQGKAALGKDIVNDYLAKFPPTVTFQSTDFDINKYMLEWLNKNIAKMEVLDTKRKGIKKTNDPDVFGAIYEECNAEAYIRCLTGNVDPDGTVMCHATIQLDDQKRKVEIQKLKAGANKNTLVEKNFSLQKPNALMCHTAVFDLAAYFQFDYNKYFDEKVK